VALADVYGKTEFEWVRVIAESRRALEIDSGLAAPHAYIARAFYHIGLLERAVERAEAALELDAEAPGDAMRTRAVALLLAGRYGDAGPLLEEVQRRSGRPLSDYNLALAYYYGGDRARGERVMEELTRTSATSSSQRARAWLAAFLAARGERKRASDLADETAAGKYMDHHVAAGLANAYAQLGRPAEALRWLRNAADTGFPCHAWYARDPLLEPLREDPAFQAWLEGLRLKVVEAEHRYAGF
jgi:tetratricopeptide (TPR) repeat protein